MSSAGARTFTEAPASPAEVKSDFTGNDDETDPNFGDAAADPTYIDAESSEALSTAEAFVSVPSTDPALWNTSDSKLVDYWIRCGPETCRNRDGSYIKSSRNIKNINMKLNNSAFEKTLLSGETKQRQWLLYSPSTGCVFCFVCRLFKPKSQAALEKDGLDAWDHINRLSDHEQSSDHQQALTEYSIRAANKETLDRVLVGEMEKERNCWREVLKRIYCEISGCSGPSVP